MPVLTRQTSIPRTLRLGGCAAKVTCWCALAAAFLLFSSDWRQLADWLGDSDDALRIVSARELLANWSWFDRTSVRVGAPEPLTLHWSRLVDLPLATGIMLLSGVVGAEYAELTVRAVWPVFLFFLLLLVLVREALRQGGAWGGALVIVLVLTSVTALVQFRPGRIDHHNAQIFCAVAGLLLLARGVDAREQGWLPGVLLGLGLSVGYEAFALVFAGVATAALLVVWRPSEATSVVQAVAALAATLFAVLFATVPPSRWMSVHCDALSLNVPVLATCCAVGLWAAVKLAADAHVAVRLAICAGATVVGVGLFAVLEPACLAGPFGQVNPALKSLWLDDVMEGKSAAWLLSQHPAAALTYFVFVLAGAAAQVAAWKQQRTLGSALMTAVVLASIVLGSWQIRLMPYAGWLVLLPLALWCARLPGTRSLSAPTVRIAAAVLLSQTTMALAIDTVAGWRRTDAPPATTKTAEVGRACSQTSTLRPLGTFAPGLIAADLDLGPYIVAATPHRVVAGPYHRLDKGIMANEALLAGSPDEAMPRLAALGVDYIALCAADATGTGADSSLRAQLLAGGRFPFLQELHLQHPSAIRLWRVLR
jgi:hypothetical protein